MEDLHLNGRSVGGVSRNIGFCAVYSPFARCEMLAFLQRHVDLSTSCEAGLLTAIITRSFGVLRPWRHVPVVDSCSDLAQVESLTCLSADLVVPVLGVAKLLPPSVMSAW